MNKLSQTHLRYGYDIAKMFIFLNISLFVVTILFYSIFDFPSLVNQTTLIIYFLLFLQLHFFLVMKEAVETHSSSSWLLS